MKQMLAACISSVSITAAPALAGEIDLRITGFSSDTGMARVVLMHGIGQYTGAQPVTRTATVPISGGRARWRAQVTPGTYAVIAHHDRDADGVFERPVFGVPIEPYGYSNGSWTSAGLPGFDAVAFEVGHGTARQTIRIRTNAFWTAGQIVLGAALLLSALLGGLALRRRRAFRAA